jgi:Domain of unknown function (DUF222)
MALTTTAQAISDVAPSEAGPVETTDADITVGAVTVGEAVRSVDEATSTGASGTAGAVGAGNSAGTTLGDLWDRLADLRSVTAGLRAEVMSGEDAAQVVTFGVALERLGAALRTRFALRVETTGAYETTGHKSAARWMAEAAGESVGQALGVLRTAAQLAESPVVDRAFADGQLSLAQAAVTADAGALDPSSQARLVETAASGSLKELKGEAARVKRKAYGEASVAEREARVQRRRYCRIWSPSAGGVRLEAWLPTVDGARMKAVLEKEADRVFKEAWAAGERDRPDAYLADALVRVVAGDGRGEPKAQVAVRVDAAALRRGFVDGDETCEIPGVGPIPVDVAKDLLGDAVFHVVVTEGADIRAVTSKKRTIPASLRRALMERDRTCAVPGCDATEHLQIDHRWDFAKGGPTELANTCRLCPPHHRMKTAGGFRLVDVDGQVRWLKRAGP